MLSRIARLLFLARGSMRMDGSSVGMRQNLLLFQVATFYDFAISSCMVDGELKQGIG